MRKSREKRKAEQASEAKQRSDPKRQNAAIAVPNKFTISGGNDERVTPVPIPNTEVKPLSADGTWLDTARESRSLPDSTWEARKSFSFFRLLGVFVDNSFHPSDAFPQHDRIMMRRRCRHHRKNRERS